MNHEIEDSCLECQYMKEDGCSFIDEERSIAQGGIDCIVTYKELLMDMI